MTAAKQIIVNTTRGERAFPIGQYSAVKDKRGSTGHTLRRLRLLPGLNKLSRAVIGKARAEVSEDELAALLKHPDIERLIQQGVLKVYDDRAAIPASERIGIAANTIDLDILDEWAKDESDPHVKAAISKQIKVLVERGQQKSDSQVSEAPERAGQTPKF
jgi:hypothetical protein